MLKQVFRHSKTALKCDCRRILSLQSCIGLDNWPGKFQGFTVASRCQTNQADEEGEEDFDMFGADVPRDPSIRKKYSSERQYEVSRYESGVVGILDPALNILLPNAETHRQLFDGVPYLEVPVAHIVATPNNTHITVTKNLGKTVLARSSGGRVGFKNAGKSSDVAAQTCGYAVGQSLRRDGFKSIRAKIKGIGKGREASVLGLTLAGIKVISITDDTLYQAMARPRARPRK